MSINSSESSNSNGPISRPLSRTLLPSHPTDYSLIRSTQVKARVFLILSAFVLLLVACGPEVSSMDHNAMREEAQRVANEYGTNLNLEQANSALAELDVSNVNQWLKFVTEDTIRENGDPSETTMLVRLALDLGIRSAMIDRYGIDAGLLDAPPAVEIVAPAASVLEQSSSSVIDAFKASGNANTDAPEQKGEVVAVNEVKQPESTQAESTQAESAAESNQQTAEVKVDTATSENATDSNTADSNTADSNTAEEEPAAETAPEKKVAEAPTDPVAVASAGMNVRSGPGTSYDVIGAIEAGANVKVIAKNQAGDWWQVKFSTGATGWLYSQLTTVEGNTAGVAVAANIPQPPPAATPVPPPPPTATYYAPPTATYYAPPTATYYAPPTAPPAPPPTAPPAPPPTAPPAPPPTAPPAPPPTAPPAPAPTAPPAPAPAVEKPATGGNTFKLIERRLWGVQENGGFLAGDSVNCGDKRELRVRVIDAAGNPINGVTVHGVYTKVDVSTGSQGKGDGVAEYVLGDGEDVEIIRDSDGSSATSDRATNLVTKPHLIDTQSLIQAGYCRDDASCKKNVVDPYACGGHYSWDVKFQRSY